MTHLSSNWKFVPLNSSLISLFLKSSSLLILNKLCIYACKRIMHLKRKRNYVSSIFICWCCLMSRLFSSCSFWISNLVFIQDHEFIMSFQSLAFLWRHWTQATARVCIQAGGPRGKLQHKRFHRKRYFIFPSEWTVVTNVYKCCSLGQFGFLLKEIYM